MDTILQRIIRQGHKAQAEDFRLHSIAYNVIYDVLTNGMASSRWILLTKTDWKLQKMTAQPNKRAVKTIKTS
jgi:hypothetical protein